MIRTARAAALAVACLGFAASWPAQAEAPVKRIRGTIASVDGNTVSIKPRTGEAVTVRLGDGVRVAGASAAKLTDIQPDSYIGTAATPQPDGTLKALEVAVFAPSMRGTGDGHYPWDLEKENTMTNGAVGAVTGTTNRTVTVTYAGGQKTITVPDDVPVVALAPADASLIKPGARVVAFTRADASGTAVADRLVVGQNGTVPPM
ncbi:hypothetical protein [Methylobacterium gossipiicola]|uniref:DUF5666 domain-containing protein n=1 Tax=Methylobacterium gossipiicola TaxID=582675 RepID=A0A1I2T597_9HYPH|nr:hypothetical protein [Methylobacterium gossipiicola]SFG60000.1 hypothetical protein SAMN05192565_106122 [Methylobacterium gossipiicola]